MPPKEKNAVKWSNRTKAYKLLKEGLTDGTIDNNLKPKDVHESHIEFLKYPLTSFRAAFNRMKAELGVHVREDGKLQLPKCRTCLVAARLTWHCFGVSSSILEDKFEDDDDNDNDDNAAADDTSNDKKPSAKKAKFSNTANTLNIHPMLEWEPQIAMSVWVNDKLHNMVTVAIALTGGVDINHECKVYVSDNNRDLVASEKMIEMLANVEMMHKHLRLKDPNALPPSSSNIMGFHHHYSGIRKREEDDMYPTAIIPLPFPVQKTIINMYKVGNANGSRMLYLELRAVDYNDYKVAAKSDLVMIN